PAHTRNRKDVLDDDRAADQERQVDAEDDDERRDRVAEDVTPKDREPADSLYPCGVDEVARQHRQRAGAQSPDEDRRERELDPELRQEQVLQMAKYAVPVAVHREDRDVDREDEDEDDSEPEAGHRKRDQKPAPRGLVEDAAFPQRRDHADRNR